jgi:hypothetical protein
MKEPTLQRFLRILGASPDPTLAVLRSHLLLDELLLDVLRASGQTPGTRKAAKETAAARERAATLLLSGDVPDHFLHFVSELRHLRNALAHEVEVPDLAQRLEALGALVPTTPSQPVHPADRHVYLLTLSVARVGGALNAWAQLAAPQTIAAT